jgi:hypothetical protein
VSNDWSTTPPSAQQFPAVPASPADATAATLRRIAEQARENARNLLRSAGITISDALMTVSRSLRVEGDLTATGQARLLADLELGGDGVVTGLLQSENFVPGVSGWRLTPTGLEVYTITLGGGIVGNAALANPVLPAAFSGSGAGFATGAFTWETKGTSSIVVPAGFTKAIVSANGYARVTNTSGASGFLMVRPMIQGVAGNEGIVPQISALSYGAESTNMSVLLNNLTPGDAVTAACQVATSQPWGADSGNLARVSGTVTWFR